MFTKPFTTNHPTITTETFEYGNETATAIETLSFDTQTGKLLSRHFTDFDQSFEMYFEPEYALWFITKGQTGTEEFEYTSITGSKNVDETWQQYLKEIQTIFKDPLPNELKEEGHQF